MGEIDMESLKFITDENLEILEMENQAAKNCDSLEDVINDEFHETLVYKIKMEVKHAIHKRTRITLITLNVETRSIEKNTNDLVNVLLDQIEFLKGELKSFYNINDHASVTPINTDRHKGACNYNTVLVKTWKVINQARLRKINLENCEDV